MEDSDSNSNLIVAVKEKRKRKKFIRKVKCQVCEDVANDHIHYGATTCYSCRAFFRRSITSHSHYKCAKTNSCEINSQTRKQCQACRMEKCQQAGMKATWVMTEEEKREKKEAAIAKKRLKLIGIITRVTFNIKDQEFHYITYSSTYYKTFL